MEILFVLIIGFLFLLAIFDLSVGVSNDAVNFLNSAIGAKAAPMKRIMTVAAIGVFLGAAMSNGMMDIARHGIFRPEHYSFYEILCIFMAVMATDIMLLDVFNSLGLPTSTTVSMVFELLGASFTVALIKQAGDSALSLGELLNTEKALSVIMGIFVSVAIAFVFGTIVQFIVRTWFSYGYKKKLQNKIGLYGGIATTAIVYFMLIKGTKGMSFMTPEIIAWIGGHTLWILLGCFVFFSIVMQVLHYCGVNVLKVVVLTGTFSLAMAFAGNDLVNFIGVPLSGFSAYQDFAASGNGDAYTHLMGAMNSPADTPVYFLIIAGLIMVISLATSKKAQNVSKTEIGLGSCMGDDELFGTSRIARKMVRLSISVGEGVKHIVPRGVRRWFDSRFDSQDAIMEEGAAFDLVRASVNLMLASMLIALGTSLKLPLSTTFVTFMVAMGTSLADRAWGRESAVFRITGVISVIGGWFITAGAAFLGAGLVVLLMYFGGQVAMMGAAIGVMMLIIRNNVKFAKERKDDEGDVLLRTVLSTEDKEETWNLLKVYIASQQRKFISFATECYGNIVRGFVGEDEKVLDLSVRNLLKEKDALKNYRRKETVGFRAVSREKALEKSAWFYSSNNCCMSVLYNLRRMGELCHEHVDNNFLPLPAAYRPEYDAIYKRVSALMADIGRILDAGEGDSEKIRAFRGKCDEVKELISDSYHKLLDQLHEGNDKEMTVIYVYLNMLQETREMIASLRKYLRAWAKLQNSEAVISL